MKIKFNFNKTLENLNKSGYHQVSLDTLNTKACEISLFLCKYAKHSNVPGNHPKDKVLDYLHHEGAKRLSYGEVT